MNRRTVLAGCAGVGTLALAGCTALFDLSPPSELEGVTPDPDQLPRPTLGSGAVTVDSYEDLGCPSCHEFNAETFPEIQSQYIADDTIEYRHFDFVIGAADESVALASAARAVQDDTRTDEDPTGEFFAYKRAVMRSDDWSEDSLAAMAEAHGASGDAVRTAIAEGTYHPQLRADWDRADDEGLTGTPTVLVEGTQVDAFDLDEIDAEIQAVR